MDRSYVLTKNLYTHNNGNGSLGALTQAATKNKKAALLAKIKKLGYILYDSKTKINSRLFVKRSRGIHMVNCIIKKQKKKTPKYLLCVEDDSVGWQ